MIDERTVQPFRPVGCLLAFACMAWLTITSLGGFATLVWSELGDTSCVPERGSSNFGHGEWSWFPLGLDCTYSQAVNGFDRHDPPGWGLTAFWIVDLGLGTALVYAMTRRWRETKAALTEDLAYGRTRRTENRRTRSQS